MPNLNDFEVWIECGGKRLTEYAIKKDDITATCWIASEVDKEFVIQYQNHRAQQDIQCELVVMADGEEIYNHITNYDPKLTIQGMVIDKKTVRTLMFSRVNFTNNEHDMLAEHPQSTRELGVITVRISEVYVVRDALRGHSRPVPKLSDALLDEKDYKGISHKVTTGRDIKVKEELPWGKVSYEPYDDENPGPIALFKFKYRPKEFLIAKGLIKSNFRLLRETNSTSTLNTTLSSQSMKKRPNRRDATEQHNYSSGDFEQNASASTSRKRPSTHIDQDEQGAEMDGTIRNVEDGSDLSDLFERLGYLQQQQTEIQRKQERLMNNRESTKDPEACLKSLSFWHARMRDTQEQLAETVRALKRVGPGRSPRKKTRIVETLATIDLTND